MADIFLSYSRVDRPRAQVIAQALEAEGFSVWWDKVLRAGQTYDKVTESMLSDSHVVIVLWSKTSVDSTWVRAEATQGQRKCVLIPAMIEDAERPIMFELVQTADLIGWDGDRTDERWGGFVEDLKRGLEQEKPGSGDVETASPAPSESPAAKTEAPTPPPAVVAPTPAPEVQQPAPAAPQPAPLAVEANKPAKKKSSAAPLFIVATLGLLGAGGWYGYENFLKDELLAPTPTCDVCPPMAELAGGRFIMGSPDDEPSRSGNEGPQREVTLPPFAISRTEVTRDQWQVCVDDGACEAAIGDADGGLPITRVSWHAANAYANWLTETSGQVYRLPTEAEWEYAARGGTTTAFWWGATPDGGGIVRDAVRDTASLPANEYNVSGMLGNVREWVTDCYVRNYNDAPVDGSAVITGDCRHRVVRGGSFRTGLTEHRAASRARIEPDTIDRSLGFRVVAERN